MSASSKTTVVGVFDTIQQAYNAARALRAAGFQDRVIGVLGPQTKTITSRTDKPDEVETSIEGGMGIGAAAGGLSGLGLGLAVASGIIPPLGPVIAAGSLAALIASALGGAAAGTVIGGLVGLGVSEDDATYFDEQFQAGKSLVTVAAAGRETEAQEIIEHHEGTIRAAALV